MSCGVFGCPLNLGVAEEMKLILWDNPDIYDTYSQVGKENHLQGFQQNHCTKGYPQAFPKYDQICHCAHYTSTPVPGGTSIHMEVWQIELLNQGPE